MSVGSRLWRIEPLLLVLLGMALLGVLVVLVVTRHNIGLTADSVRYIEAARRLVSGEGYTSGFTGKVSPITHWPPLYPALLAAAGLLGIDPLIGARALACLIFGANVCLVGWLVHRHGSGAALPTIASSVLLLSSADLLEVHAMAWSEPLFLMLCLLAIHHLAVYLEEPRSRRWLVAAAALVGLAALTRYVGITLVIAGGLVILWLSPVTRSRRVVDVALFSVLSMALPMMWAIRTWLLTGSSSPRALAFNPPGLPQLTEAARTTAAWVVPPIVPDHIRIFLLIAALIAAVIGLVRGRQFIRGAQVAPGNRILKVVLGCVVVYVLFLALSISLFDADVAFDARILSPVQMLLVVAAGLILSASGRVRAEIVAALALVVALQSAHTLTWVNTARHGLGFSSEAWRSAQVWSVIAELPGDVPLYSNGYDAIHMYTGRVVIPLPAKFNVSSLARHDDYGDHLTALRADLAARRGYVVYLRESVARPYMPSEAELEQALFPVERRTFPGGVLYHIPHDSLLRAMQP